MASHCQRRRTGSTADIVAVRGMYFLPGEGDVMGLKTHLLCARARYTFDLLGRGRRRPLWPHMGSYSYTSR